MDTQAAQQAHDRDEKDIKIGQLTDEVKELKDRLAYLTADLENIRKRSFTERMQEVDAAKRVLLADLLDIVDNFDRAFAGIKKEDVTPQLQGFELIYKELKRYLERHKVTEMTDVKTFNPEFHEAVAHVDNPDLNEGDVVEVFQKGYLYHGSVLRPARVSVKS